MDSRGQRSRTRTVVSYALLPKVLPRIADLFFTGFGFFAFFVAQVFRGVRLLPEGHPSLNPANMGEYGLRDIIILAGRHLVWRKENIDQIIVYIAIILGLVLLILQAFTFLIAIAVPQATAAGLIGFSSIFGQPPWGPEQDIAFILLDRVFGVPGLFNSCVSTSTPCYGVSANGLGFDNVNTVYKPAIFPWPYHEGLHALFQFYSMGLLLVAVFILLYFVIVIVAETAQTGTPFGKRFNTVWAPIRLVVAFGLLIPITYGLNSAQYITLYAAKWGSNFATNGWVNFNDAMQLQARWMVLDNSLVVKPKEPDAGGLVSFMTLAHTCKVFEETIMNDVDVVAAGPDADASCPADRKGRKIEAYIVKPGVDAANSRIYLRDTDFTQALNFAEKNDIRIRFGDLSCNSSNAQAGDIEPLCGELTMPINSLTSPGAMAIQEGYYNLIKHLWGGYPGSDNGIATYTNPGESNGPNTDSRAEYYACTRDKYNPVLGSGSGDRTLREYALSYYQNGVGTERTGVCRYTVTPKMNEEYDGQLLPPPPEGWQKAARDNYNYGDQAGGAAETPINSPVGTFSGYAGATNPSVIVRNIVKNGVVELENSILAGDYDMSVENLQRGWAVAAIWYNRIAEMNGALIGAAWDIPSPTIYPATMMMVLAEKRQNNIQTDNANTFSPNVANGTIKLPKGDAGEKYALIASDIYKGWSDTSAGQTTGNMFANIVNLIFGTEGLMNLRFQADNRSHPLAMLVGVGKGLIEASIRNLTVGVLGALGSVGLSAIPHMGGFSEVLSVASSLFFSIATITLTAGFILFYVIPFLPFLYFFFAVGNWLKGVFEAMVGVPLWALAHLRIDGNGLPGDAAMNGYFMLFEIFLRPLMIIFGFIASITIFSAMATVFHEIFEVAVKNLTGSQGSGASKAVDNFFYTVMYAVIMYMMALSSFKLIDLIPNQIMRWMGSSVSTFSDMNGDPAGSLTQYTAIAGQQVVSGMTGGVKELTNAGRGFGGAVGNMMTPKS